MQLTVDIHSGDYTEQIQPLTYNTSFAFTQENFVGDDDSAQKTFSGFTTIQFKALTSMQTVRLNSVGMKFSSVYLTAADGVQTCLCGPNCSVPNCSYVVKEIG